MAQIVKYRKSDFNKIYDKTVENMKSLGTYKAEFVPLITRYSEMRIQFNIIMSKWYDSGCVMSEVHVNKVGASNVTKSNLYQCIENLRKELLELEMIMGLTPLGLKRINDKIMSAPQKMSKLAQALNNSG